MQKAKQIFIAALFSSIIFVINFLVPPPISYLLIVVQAVILALANLFLGKAGATYVGLIGGLMSALARPAFGPFTFLFTFLFGLLVDVFCFIGGCVCLDHSGFHYSHPPKITMRVCNYC